MKTRDHLCLLLVATCLQLSHGQVETNQIQDVRVECNRENIVVKITTSHDFNGMVYPKGLSKNTTCMSDFEKTLPPVRYLLPLRSCNTMSTDVGDGIEFFNTIVVQPHRKLVTNQGRGYHIRCKYQTKEETVTTNFNVSFHGTTPLFATASMPTCSMHIFVGDGKEEKVAENVRIGDPLTLQIKLADQSIYGMKVTDCWVRDGLSLGEQRLINENGCPVDYEIMGPLTYEDELRSASVRFQAHKFPYTPSVYYQCNVKLCIRSAGQCSDVPPQCDEHGNNIVRRKREIIQLDDGTYVEEENEPEIEVYSGLYVSEEGDIIEDDEELEERDKIRELLENEEIERTDQFCLSPRNFAIGIAIAGLVLMIAVVILVCVLLSKRRRKHEHSTTGSSVYSGPYSNGAYSHSS